MHEMLQGDSCPQALIVGSDMIAYGVLEALREAGRQRELRLLIYQDIPSVKLPEGRYALLKVYPNILWQKAIQMLIEQIKGRTETITTVITPKLFIKD